MCCMTDVFTAAGSAGIYVIPIAWTLVDSGTFTSESVPRMEAVTDVSRRIKPFQGLHSCDHKGSN